MLPNAPDGATHGTPPSPSSGRLLHSDVTNEIINAMYSVHDSLGFGFLESVYAHALVVDLRRRGLHVERNVPFEIVYRGVPVGRYVADLIVESKVVVETKVAKAIDATHRAQILNYLRFGARGRPGAQLRHFRPVQARGVHITTWAGIGL